MSGRQPRVTGISPLQGTPGTKITIRGEKLGRNASDFISVQICGVDCTLSSEWISPSKIIARPFLSEGEGDIVVTTKAGGVGKSLVKFHCYIPEKIGFLEESGVYLEEDEDDENSPLPEVDVLNILSDSFPPIPDDLCNLNLASFCPEEFVSQIYSSVPFDSLKSGLMSLKTQLSQRAQAPIDSLKRNIFLHFECYRRLKELSATLTNDSFRNDISKFSDLHYCVSKCFSSLLSRHDLVERNRQLITHFNRWRNLFSLPSKLEKNIARGNYQEAIDDFERAKRTRGSSYADNSILDLIFDHSERQIERLREKMGRSLLEDKSLSIQEQSHALVISNDRAVVKEFLVVQYDKIKDLLTKDDTDPLTRLDNLSRDMTQFFPNFSSICDFCSSLNLGDDIIELSDRLPSSLLRVFSKSVKDILPDIDKEVDSMRLQNLNSVLSRHRKTVLILPSGSERQNLSRISRSTRLSCLNSYSNICLQRLSKLFDQYLEDESPLRQTNWFPKEYCEVVCEHLEALNDWVVSEMRGELKFFECSLSTSTFCRRFSQFLAVYSDGLKGFLQKKSKKWDILVQLYVDAEFMADSVVRRLTDVVALLELPPIETLISEFIKSTQRLQDDLFKRLVKIKCRPSIAPTKFCEVGGVSTRVYSLLSTMLGLCAELGLISESLLVRLLKELCDESVVGSELAQLMDLCRGRNLTEEVVELRSRFGLELEAISYFIN